MTSLPMVLLIKLLGRYEGEADEWIEFGEVSAPANGAVVFELDNMQLRDVLHVPMVQLEKWQTAFCSETGIEYQVAYFRIPLGEYVRVETREDTDCLTPRQSEERQDCFSQAA